MLSQRKHRLIPPAPGHGFPNPCPANGRTYSGAEPIDVEHIDGQVLITNGWMALGLVGDSAERPTDRHCPDFPAGLPAGLRYIDTDLGTALIWDAVAKCWRNATTGAVIVEEES